MTGEYLRRGRIVCLETYRYLLGKLYPFFLRGCIKIVDFATLALCGNTCLILGLSNHLEKKGLTVSARPFCHKTVF
jgi:hypothetical protein